MTASDQSTRERVRALVRDALRKAAPAEEPAISARPVPPPTTKTTTPDEAPIARDESAKTIITEDDVRGLERGARLRVGENARLTPLAADAVRERGIELVRRSARGGGGGQTARTIAVGADHGGYEMKEELRAFLAELGYQVRDFGTNSKEAVDYPDFAHAVARAVADKQADLGVVIDGAGIGSAMVANKVPGVRAAACYSAQLARNSREHNGANVLTLGSGVTGAAEMREIVRAWLASDLTEDRHRRRVAKIEAVERQHQK